MVIVGCKSDQHRNAENEMLTNEPSGTGVLTEANNNITIEYPVDTTFKIKLKGPSQDKNNWTVQTKMGGVLSLTDNYTKVIDNSTIYIFDFLVQDKGDIQLVINYGNGTDVFSQYKAKIIGGTKSRVLSE